MIHHDAGKHDIVFSELIDGGLIFPISLFSYV